MTCPIRSNRPMCYFDVLRRIDFEASSEQQTRIAFVFLEMDEEREEGEAVLNRKSASLWVVQ